YDNPDLRLMSPHVGDCSHTSQNPSSETNSRTGQSSPEYGLAVRNCAPSGGLPKTSSVEGRSAMPASAASLAWSTAWKNTMPLVAMSCLMRAMVSSTGYALRTLMRPSGPTVSAWADATTNEARPMPSRQKTCRRRMKLMVVPGSHRVLVHVHRAREQVHRDQHGGRVAGV